ncbi:GldM family protein [Flavobacterium buctense]|uniref:GldM family protein n=1 Tax=Flavobacterium buctense TaxID=1648146 RepID=A0ABU9DZA1_9FLAO
MKKIIFLFLSFLSISFYGQNDTLSVVKHTDKDLIIPKDLKTVFRGMMNELFIDVPNSKSFEVSGRDVIKKDKNIYTLNPGPGTETIVNIDIILKDNKRIKEKHVFEIRNTKSSITCFNYIKGDSLILANMNQFKDAIIRVIPGDKNLNIVHTINSFSLKIPGRKTIVIQGNKIDEKTFKEISKYASKGDEIAIFDIKVKVNITISCILISPMVIRVI